MPRLTVLSINPATKSPELMPFETEAEAQLHQRMAMGEGKLLVEITDNSVEKYEDWRQRATELVGKL